MSVVKGEAIVQECFRAPGSKMIIEIKVSLNRLPQNADLYSTESGDHWQVQARALFEHALGVHLIFENERVNYLHARFENPELEKEHIARIQTDEAKGVFQYIVTPVNHDRQPQKGESLRISVPED